MPKRRDINKVKAVSKIYANNGMNMSKALRTVGDTLEPKAMTVKASRWRNSIEIQEELKTELAKFDKTVANDIFCIANLIEIINDSNSKTSDKVNALNVLAKVIGASNEGATQVNIYTDLLSDYKPRPDVVDVKSIPITVVNNSKQSAPNDVTITIP
jgi:hypothetical protein